MNFIIWNQKLGRPECPYMRRWVFDFKFFSIRIHNWFYGDDPRHFHDHPWNFYVFVLKGAYLDVSPDKEEWMFEGDLEFRRAEHRHTVHTDGAWTLLITGPERREWGFWLKNKTGKDIWFKAKRYFLKKGHHLCAQQ